MDRKEYEKRFDEILIDSIDEAFSCLGESAKKTIYYNLEEKFFIARTEIPYRLEDFSDKLELIFGAGARHLEIIIMKKLHEKVSFFYDWEGPSWLVPNVTFDQYVNLLRLSYEDKGQTREIEVQVDAGENPKQQTR